MIVRNKIGFHCGPGGNPTGIGDYMSALDAAGIPFIMKSVDHYGFCHEATSFTNADHVICFRLSNRHHPGGFKFDTPDYFIPAAEAAAKHWEHMLAELPPEFNKERVWLETINEVDKERSDWLGHFAFHIGELALRDGYKLLQFGWSSGEPETAHWETPGMLRYFQQCADHPDQLGVSLHEYSFVRQEIFRLKGDLVGRFTRLFDVCDRRGIPRPKVLMSEWGWTHSAIPDVSKALDHIEKCNALYAPYPEIIGAAIWYLGEWFGPVANQTQRLIKPVTDFSLTYTIEVEPHTPEETTTPQPPPTVIIPIDDTEETPPPPVAPTPLSSNALFLADITIPDDTPMQAGTPFTKTWRVKNTGESSWGAGYKLVAIAGDPMTDEIAVDVPACAPGQSAELSVSLIAPHFEGTRFGDWRLQDPQGEPFGDVLFLRIQVTPQPSSAARHDLAFAADVTIPDDTEIKANQPFTKTWQIKNTGDTAWPNGFQLSFVGGSTLSSRQSVPLPTAQPGEVVAVSIEMEAPTVPGVHWADWRAQTDLGEFFGEIVYVRIVVPRAVGESRIQPLSQNDPRWKHLRLGEAGSDSTLGDWGCLVTCFAMLANAHGKDLTPEQLNERMIRKSGFVNLKETRWDALARVYADMIYEGRVSSQSDPRLAERIDGALRAGNPVAIQVDYTPESPYTPNDQHWVLVVGRDGNDYRINDPWLFPSQETSLRMRYGRPGQSLRDGIMSAIFYRPVQPSPALPVRVAGVLSAMAGARDTRELEGERPLLALQRGIHLDFDLAGGSPADEHDLKGLNWIRFPLKISAQPKPSQRNVPAALKLYEPHIRSYSRKGVGALLVLNHETVNGNAPWHNGGEWETYISHFAHDAAHIAKRFARYGERIAYELWPAADLSAEQSHLGVPPAAYAQLLEATAASIRQHAPKAQIVLGGLASPLPQALAYLKQVEEAFSAGWPVDAIGLQPYGRWATRAPFDWGQRHGTIHEMIEQIRGQVAERPLWITGIGVPSAEALNEGHLKEVADYLRDLFFTVEGRYVEDIPVAIWYAWSDALHHAGVVGTDGVPKDHVYNAFRDMRNREL